MAPRDLLLALIVVLVWGLNFIAIKWGVALMPPLLLTALRYLLAALPAVFFVARPRTSARLVVLYGLFVGAAQFGLLFSAIRLGMPAGLASLLLQTQAFFTMAFATLLLGERIGGMQVAGAGIAFAGILAIATERLGGATLVPLAMTLLAAACWGVANLATKRAGKVDMLGFVVWSSLVPPLPLLALSLLVEGPAAIASALANFSALAFGVIAWNGYLSTLVGYGLWSVLLSRYPASTVAPFSLLVPVVGLASGVLVLGEPLSALEIGGAALVFAGLVVNIWGSRLPFAGRWGKSRRATLGDHLSQRHG